MDPLHRGLHKTLKRLQVYPCMLYKTHIMNNRMLTLCKFAVYEFHSACHQSESKPLGNYTILDSTWIHYFFGADKTRANTFNRFLSQGFKGIVWYESNEWISYAWMSTPETLGPPHLPRWIRELPVYWIFYCRTKEQYQRRGFYKASIALLAQWARERDPNAKVYIDASPDNIPSIKAIESVGFVPAGTITTLTLQLPMVSFPLWGRWDKNAMNAVINKEGCK